MQARSEHQKAQAASTAELIQLREQLSSTREELTRLSENHKKIQQELTEAQAQLKASEEARNRPQAAMPAALLAVTPRPAPRDIVAAQKALTELGYGPLEADGVVGPGTREAIEKYQRETGLTVTGALHAETLQALLAPASQVAEQ
ncbi:peptidoglycan-binding protein [Microvirga sp. GCM10011540]|uniref:peptidoglycan-binding domain-containing protein n=1 Tax=Microvirga sp. GCM10011540 TaxID=3317338 RepID=UPI003617D5B5